MKEFRIEPDTEVIEVETEDVTYHGEPLNERRVEEIVARFDKDES